MEYIKRIVITDSGPAPSVQQISVPDEITHIKIGVSLGNLGIVSPDSRVIKGDTGDQGLQGVQGLKGDTGSQGPQGDTGLTGPKGDTGAQGSQGAKGDTGDQGPAGHSPALSWAGDQLAVDGVADGPHLTGPQGVAPPGTATKAFAAAMAVALG